MSRNIFLQKKISILTRVRKKYRLLPLQAPTLSGQQQSTASDRHAMYDAERAAGICYASPTRCYFTLSSSFEKEVTIAAVSKVNCRCMHIVV